VHLKAMKDFINDLAIFFESTALNENIVKINSNFALSNEVGKD
jgi:hypothetical protein